MLWITTTVIVACLAKQASSSPQVMLGNSTLVGVSMPGLNQDFFGGIPYAEAPVGNLRFTPPVLKPSPDVPSFDASQFGPACAQLGTGLTPSGVSLTGFNITNVSEDCLSINVFRPTGLNTSSPLPVMVWIFGGGFDSGAALQYNASALVAHSVLRGTPIIYINFNYRLGPLGFPSGIEATKGGALNLGLKDSMTALEWVQQNIGKFGGDPQKVTVFGESAGSTAIADLFLNQNFSKLVRGAIFQSGSADASSNVTLGESTWQSFATAVPECAGAAPNDTFGCLRSASFASIVNASVVTANLTDTEFPFGPVVDGPGGIIPDVPSKLLLQGQFARIPFIAGANQDEGTLFTSSTVNSTEEIEAGLTSTLASAGLPPDELARDVAALLVLYPDDPSLGSPFGTGNNTFGLSSQFKRAAAIAGDTTQAGRRRWTQIASSVGVKVFTYLLTDPQTLSPPFLGVNHGTDIQYIYGAIPGGPSATTNGTSAISLSHNMMDYWVSFATSLDPNDSHGNVSRTHWTQYTPTSENVIQSNGGNLTMIPDTYRQEQISLINAAETANF